MPIVTTAWMALASSISGHAGLRPYPHGWCTPCARAGQRRRAKPLVHRRELLGASTLFVGSNLVTCRTVAQAATAVYHEVSVDITASANGKPEPVEDPPTRVKATGRILASEYAALRPDMGAWPLATWGQQRGVGVGLACVVFPRVAGRAYPG